MKCFKVTEIPDGDYEIDKIKAFSVNGLDGDYFMERSKLYCTVSKDSVPIYSLRFNANSILLGRGRDKCCFEIFNYENEYVGFIDEIPNTGNIFALKLYEDIYTCIQVTDEVYLVYENSNLVAYVNREDTDDIIEYTIHMFLENFTNILTLITLYIDRKWFEDDKLKSIADMGLKKLAHVPSFPKMVALKCRMDIKSFERK